MDFFQHRYYRINKVLLKMLGMWPYQSIRVRAISIFVILFLAVSVIVPQVIIIMKNLDDRDFIMECAVPLITEGEFFSRHFTFVFNSHKLLKLLNRIRSDWEVWNRDRDIHILHQYAENGRNLTKVYAVLLISACIIFLTVPVIPKFIDVFFKNGTEPGQFPVPVDYYFIDVQKNYFYAIVHCSMCAIIGFFTVIACDSMFVIYVQHSCGLFAILRHKLERLDRYQVSPESGNVVEGLEKPAIVVEYLAWCISKHNHAIEYAELLSVTFTWFFFFAGAINVLLISMEGVQIIERTNEPEITMKFIFCIIVALGHVYIGSYMGQILIDHSISIRNYILQGNWYMLPLKAQKILLMMMMRCNIPCKLTAGKLTFISVETFVLILKTSLSYFTLLSSV